MGFSNMAEFYGEKLVESPDFPEVAALVWATAGSLSPTRLSPMLKEPRLSLALCVRHSKR